jgi:predicted DNA-binding protein with PD1-like motif
LINRIIILALLLGSCMTEKSATTVETLRLKPGEDIYVALQNFVQQEKIEAAFLVTCVGSLTEVSIRYANQEKPALLKGHFEILSLVGTLSSNGMHLHISIADGEGNCKGGHLTKGSKVYTTAEIVLGILPDVRYLRELDSTYGYKELVVKKKEE